MALEFPTSDLGTELALVAVYSLHLRDAAELAYALELPGVGVEGMLVEEVASSVDLFFVERHYELHVCYGLHTDAFQRRLVG